MYGDIETLNVHVREVYMYTWDVCVCVRARMIEIKERRHKS